MLAAERKRQKESDHERGSASSVGVEFALCEASKKFSFLFFFGFVGQYVVRYTLEKEIDSTAFSFFF